MSVHSNLSRSTTSPFVPFAVVSATGGWLFPVDDTSIPSSLVISQRFAADDTMASLR